MQSDVDRRSTASMPRKPANNEGRSGVNRPFAEIPSALYFTLHYGSQERLRTRRFEFKTERT